jgi:hypothetical protein
MHSFEMLEKRLFVEVEDIKGRKNGVVHFIGNSSEYSYAFYIYKWDMQF